MHTITKLFANPSFSIPFGMILGIICAVAGQIIAIWFNQKAEAARSLRQAIADMAGWVEVNWHSYYPIEWDKFIVRQCSAAREYKSFLRNDSAIRFEALWDNYIHPDENIDHAKYYQQDRRKLFEKLDAIATFTQKNWFAMWLDDCS